MTPNYCRDVALFHTAMNLPLFGMTEDQLTKNLPVRKRLIDEEFYCEFVPAFIQYQQGDSTQFVEVIDAICDSIYVLLGTSMAIEGVGEQGMLRCNHPNTIYNNWHGLTYTLSEMAYAYGLIEAVKASWETTDWPAAGKASGVFVRIAAMLIDLGESLTPQFSKCWDEVQRSNMAKAGGPVVNGKQRKPAGWLPPDLSSLLAGGAA